MPISSIVATMVAITACFDQLAALDFEVLEGLGVSVGAITTPLAGILRRGRGRPRKFSSPSRAITLTLPESVLEALRRIDPDPSRAIVQLAGRRAPTNGKEAAELTTFGRRAIITVRPTNSLKQRTGIDLVPLPDGRALISFEQPTSIAELELTIFDALEDPNLSEEDRHVFEAIGAILKEARRSQDVTLLRRTIIMLESATNGHDSKSKPRKSATR